MDTTTTVIFHRDAGALLFIGGIALIVSITSFVRGPRLQSVKRRNVVLALAIGAGVLGVFSVGKYYHRHGKPLDALIVSRAGVTCAGWGFWLPWREVSFVDQIEREIGSRGHPRGWFVIFDLKDSGAANHPWPPATEWSKQVHCNIGDLDQPPEAVVNTIQAFWRASS